VSALDGLFGRYAVPPRNAEARDDAVRVNLELADPLTVKPPPGGEIVVASEGLRASAFESQLFVEVEGLCVSRADVDARVVDVWIAPEGLRALWSVQHLAILPLVLEFLRRRSFYPIHAAGLEWDGGALLLPAVPGGGKTTLAIALVRAGMRLLSDDMPFLWYHGGQILARGFAEDVNVCADGIGFFEELAFLGRRRPNERGKLPFDVEEAFLCSMCDVAQPRLLIFPHIAHVAGSTLRPMGKTEALLALLDHSLPPLGPGLRTAHFAAVLDAVSQCDCYELETGVDPNEAAAQLMDLLAASAPPEPPNDAPADRLLSITR
jgi:hypothetical protein